MRRLSQGELDLSGSPQLEAALLEAEQSHVKEIVVDLGELTFVDSTGLAVLVRAADRSATNGDQLRITPGRDQVASVLRLTGLETVLPLQVEPIGAAA
jgi:anti-sigma B factor antagonist